jgi:hypothetical protein
MRFLALVVVALMFPLPAALRAAERVKAWPQWQQRRVALDRHFVVEEFRIHYALTGPDALPPADHADTDGNGVPDKIQNFALQLVTARRCYVEALGLRHPFESPRYKGRVKFVDVNVFDLGNKNGSAGDAVVNYHRPSDPPEGVEVVTIDLTAQLPAGNLSPAHELFHLFQNGYSQFKNAWYYEGTARWSEDLLRAGASPTGAVPTDGAQVEAMFALSYDASRIWQALARASDPIGQMRLPPDLRGTRYIGSPKPVIEDEAFHGGPLLRALLEELDRADDIVSKESGLDPLNWPEARQRSPENHRAIWNAVTKVCEPFAPALPIAELPATR